MSEIQCASSKSITYVKVKGAMEMKVEVMVEKYGWLLWWSRVTYLHHHLCPLVKSLIADY